MAWLDWPFTWWTDQLYYCPSMLDTVGWVIRPVKIVPDMTYSVFDGTLNPTLLYYYYYYYHSLQSIVSTVEYDE